MVKGDKTSVRELIRTCSTQIELPKGQMIHFPGTQDSSIYYIVRGAVRFVLDSYDGNEKTLYILGPDNFFNEEILFQEHEVTASIFCSEACTLWKIDSSLHGDLLKNPGFVHSVCRGMIRKNDRMQHEIQNISFMPCKQRLLHIFASECSKKRIYDQYWYDIENRYTHQELASIIGANRVTVSKLIAELCEEQQLRSINRKIQIHRDAVKRKEKEFGI